MTTKLKAESCLAVISLFFGLMTVTFGLLSKNKMICMLTSGLFFACAVASMGIGTSVLADVNSSASVYLKTHEFWLQKEQSGKKFNYGKDKIEQVASQLITTGFGRDAAE